MNGVPGMQCRVQARRPGGLPAGGADGQPLLRPLLRLLPRLHAGPGEGGLEAGVL